MIAEIRLSQNGTVISEIQDYNQLQHSIKCFELSLSGLQREALQKGLVDYAINSNTGYKALSNNALVGQGVHRTGETSATIMQQEVKFQLSLDFVSFFEIMEIIPSTFIGDMLLEIRLANTKEQILKVLPATGIAHGVTQMAENDTTILLTPPFSGFTNLADSPFIVGQSVVAVSATGVRGLTEYPITALAQADGTGVITITTTTQVTAADNTKSEIIITKGANGASAVSLTQFFVTKSELQLQVVKPPAQYIQSLMQEVQDGQMFIDVPTYTSYRSNILASIKTQTLTIPTTQNRVKAFFIVPRQGSQVGTFSVSNDKDFNYDGVYGNLRYYRSQIDGIYYPNQNIDLGVMCGGWHFSAEHIQELTKTFDAAGIPLRSLLGLKQNFMIGRSLSKYGSSTNLVGTPINVYLEYNGNGPVTSTIPNSVPAVSTAGTAYTTTVAPALVSVSSTNGVGRGMKVTIVASATAPFGITSATIVEQGSGYVDGEIVSVPSTGAVFDAITAPGTGYTGAAGVAVTGGTGTGCVVTTVDTAGAITGVTITTPGSGYTTADVLTITGGGANATFTITVTSDGRLTLTKAAPQLDVISFVHHINRVAVSLMGLEVTM